MIPHINWWVELNTKQIGMVKVEITVNSLPGTIEL